jgi:uncharacterized protein YukE
MIKRRLSGTLGWASLSSTFSLPSPICMMMAAQQDGVRLLYHTKDGNGAPVDVNELVTFAYTPTRFGGQRQWFRCLKCYRRCRKLYGGRYFRCRLCYDLRYASQREDAAQRALSRAQKIAKRLHAMWAGTTEEGYEFPPKPPRMRWVTYERLEKQYDRLQDRWGVATMARFGRYFVK